MVVVSAAVGWCAICGRDANKEPINDGFPSFLLILRRWSEIISFSIFIDY
jgi:hypothetical protein